MQRMVAGKSSRGKPRQRCEKDITDAFGTMEQQADCRRKGINFAETSVQRRPGEDMLREEEDNISCSHSVTQISIIDQ